MTLVKKAFLEDQDSDNADRNRRIGKIEDGAEKLKFVTAYKGHPRGIVCLDDGEVQHIDHPAMQEGGIAMWREYLRYMLVSALFEDEAVEHTVNKITQRTRKDEARTDDKTSVVFLLYDRLDIVDTEYDGDETEKGQRHLSPGAAELPAPGHALILYEVDLGLVAQQLDTIIIWRDRSCKIVSGMT